MHIIAHKCWLAFFELAGPSSLSKFCCSNGATRGDNYSPEVVAFASRALNTTPVCCCPGLGTIT